jgi:UDP-N-acetylmuramoylalanine--D-glutamate ligase
MIDDICSKRQTAAMNRNRKKQNKWVAPPVGVLGIGVEGKATIDFLLSQNIKEITALDRNEIDGIPAGIATLFGENHDKGLERFNTIFRSPSIRPDHPSLNWAQKKGRKVTSAISFFLEHCPAPVIGVTGTLGKGTTASLVAKMLEDNGFPVYLGGNIGSSPLEFLDKIAPTDNSVLEISSFQAMDLQVAPHITVVLKTTSEHLDWHIDLNEYRMAKAALVQKQGPNDVVVYNADSEGSRQVANSGKSRKLAYSLRGEVEEGLFVRDSKFVIRHDGLETVLPMDLDKVRLSGRFNLENIAAAILASTSAGVSLERACKTGQNFEGLPHRLEFVTQANSIRFYNDSYATRPDAAMGALSCFTQDPLAVIMGGSEKHADFDELVAALVEHPMIRHVALIGATADRLEVGIKRSSPLGFSIAKYVDLEPAMEGAVKALPKGGIVLLTPACASFGLFPNYKVRGERFRKKANRMAQSPSRL